MDIWIEENTSYVHNQKPEKCYESTCVSFKDNLYVFGGCKSQKLGRDYTFFNDVFKYEITTNIWSIIPWNRTKGVKPAPRSSHTSIIYDKKMYVFGGTGAEKDVFQDFFSFDFETQTWKEIITIDKEDIPGRYGHSCVLYGDSMIVFGGYKNTTENDIWIYYFIEKTWKKIQPSTENKEIPEPTQYQSMNVHQDSLYIYGGYNSTVFYDDLWKFDLKSLTWKNLEYTGVSPGKISNHSSELIDNQIFIFGGNRYGLYINDLYKLDLDTFQWKKIQTNGDLPSPRFGHSITLYNSTIYVFSGYDINSQYTNQLFKFHLGAQHLHFFKDFYNSKKYCDCILKVENEKFFAHKCVISQSNFLKQKILNEKEIIIEEGISVKVMKVILQFLYFGDCFVDDIDLVIDLICAASIFQLKDLETIALIYFKKLYDSTNLFSVLQRAHDLKVDSLKKLCFAYFWKQPKGISVNLEEDLLLELLGAQNKPFSDYEVLKRKSPNSEERIANHLMKLFETREFWDVKFKTKEKEFKLHRLILETFSNFLNSDEELEILIQARLLDVFVEFVYLKNLNMTEDINQYLKVYKVLMKLPKDEVHGLIVEKIIQLLNPLNLLTVLQFVYDNKINGKLKECCFEMVGDNSSSILRSILEMQFQQNQVIKSQSKMLKEHEKVIRLQQEALEILVAEKKKETERDDKEDVKIEPTIEVIEKEELMSEINENDKEVKEVSLKQTETVLDDVSEKE
eukprot:gene10118-2537_t